MYWYGRHYCVRVSCSHSRPRTHILPILPQLMIKFDMFDLFIVASLPSLPKVYNPLWTSIVLVMVIISYQSTTMAQIRHKRGISDFFRRLFKKNASGPTVPGMNSISNQAQHHQQASPIYGGGGGAGNYYGNSENQNSALSPDYYTGAASNLNAMYQPYAHAADYVFPGQVHNQQQQQQLQPQQQASNQVQYNYGNYGSIQQQQQQSIQAAQGGEGPQPQYVYPPYGSVYGQSSNQQQSQQQYYSPSHGASTHYLPPSHQYQSNGQYNNIAAASYNRPQYMSAYQPQPQSAQPGPIDQRNYFQAKPYGQSPGTIDVHQVLDQFIRSAGLSPQGDHDSVKSGMYGAESNLKPAVSIKKLISYPFYFSSSGDKPTSYGHSIRRQSNDDVLYKTAIKQNINFN
ncbi:hypothetical protein BLOT_010228 [Blomia tropicalis]|nr:hypothetical protein BLOT_010228 [Blomia tropicalis]